MGLSRCRRCAGSRLTASQIRAHFTRCPKRPAGSEHVNPRRRNSKFKRGRPLGPRTTCGWGSGAKLTERDMRAHLTICTKRPAASGVSLSTRFGPLRCSHLAPLKDQNPCRLLFCSRWPRPKRSPAPRFLRRVRAKRRPGPPRTGDQNIVGGTRPSGSNCWLYPIRSVAVLSPR